MTLKLVWDASGKDEQYILIDRHISLFFEVMDAIQDAIEDNDGSEAEQGFGRMTGSEISGVMASAVICILQNRGVSMERFLQDLRDLAGKQGWK